MPHPIVRRLTAAALFLILASAPALAAPGPASAHRSQAPRAPVVTHVPILDQLLGWLGFPAAGPLPDARGRSEKSGNGPSSGSNGVLDPLVGVLEDRGGMIDPNG